MREPGVEPGRLAALDPKSKKSTVGLCCHCIAVAVQVLPDHEVARNMRVFCIVHVEHSHGQRLPQFFPSQQSPFQGLVVRRYRDTSSLSKSASARS
jgi:hypothetical protein